MKRFINIHFLCLLSLIVMTVGSLTAQTAGPYSSEVVTIKNPLTLRDSIVSSGVISGNVAFISVGNVNAELSNPPGGNKNNITYLSEKSDETGNIRHINDATTIPNSGYGSVLPNASITNSNYSEFVINAPDTENDTCAGSLSIVYATLTWSGRMTNGRDSRVYIKVTDKDGNNLPGIEGVQVDEMGSTGSDAYVEDRFQCNDGDLNYNKFYAVHANVTEYISKAYQKSTNGSFRFYVANIPTVLTGLENKFAGWTLTIVYHSPGLPERDILIYRPHIQGELEDKNGNVPNPTFVNLGFSPEVTRHISDTATISITNFGGYRTEFRGNFIDNRNSTVTRANVDRQPALFGEVDPVDNSMQNSFGNRIEYSYRYKGVSKPLTPTDDGYTRGYDLHVVSMDTNHCVNKEENQFKFVIRAGGECHFVPVIVLMFGKPDVPAVVARYVVDKDNISAGEEFKYTLYIGMEKNSETLRNFMVNIPLSEYVDSVKNISLKFAKDGWYPRMFDETATASERDVSNLAVLLNNNAISNTPTRWSTWFDETPNNKTNFLTALNQKLFESDADNYDAFMSNPSNMSQPTLTLRFPDIEDLSNISDEAIAITITLKTKPSSSWVYLRDKLRGSAGSYIMNSETSFTTATNRASVLDAFDKNRKKFDWSSYICEERMRVRYGDGDGDGGLGGGGGGGGGTGGGRCYYGSCLCDSSAYGAPSASRTPGSVGVLTRDTNLIITIHPNINECLKPYAPDTIAFSYCANKFEFTSSDIYNEIYDESKKAYNPFNVDSLAKRDSMIWRAAQLEEIYAFAAKHGANRKQMEGLIDLSKVSATAIPSDVYDPRTRDVVECASGLTMDMFDKFIDSIMKVPLDLTDLYMMFNSKDESYTDIKKADGDATAKYYSYRNNKDYKWTVDETEPILYVRAHSPWGEDESCSTWVKVYFNKFKQDKPIVLYDGDTLGKREDGLLDTIYVCKKSDVPDLPIFKSDKGYKVYATMNLADGRSATDTILHDLPEYSFEYKLGSDVDNTVPGNSTIKVYNKKDKCTSDTLEFVVNISTSSLDETPEIVYNEKTTITTAYECQSFIENDSVEVFVNEKIGDEYYVDKGYIPVWYVYDGTTYVTKGRGPSTKVSLNEKGDTKLAVAFAAGNCIGNKRDEIVIKVIPMPDSLKEDTIHLCLESEIKANEIENWVKLNKQNIVASFRYYTDSDDALSKIDDNKNLSDIVSAVNTAMQNYASDDIFYDFYVRPFTSTSPKECPGPLTRKTVWGHTYKNDQPKFNVRSEEIDSILYCMNDMPDPTLAQFISKEKGELKSGYRWVWINEGGSFEPTKALTDLNQGLYYKYPSGKEITETGLSYNQVVVDKKYVVARLDSNSCYSKTDTFHIYVDEKITSRPEIDDPNQTRVADTIVLRYCQGQTYENVSYIPVTSTGSPDYIMQWYHTKGPKDKDDDYPNYSVAANVYNTFTFKSDVPGITYTAVRQRSKLGCVGEWQPIQVVINPNVTMEPKIDTIGICHGEDLVIDMSKVTNKTEINTESSDYSVKFYARYDSEHPLEKVEVPTTDSTPGVFTKVNDNYKYVARILNDDTGCDGPAVPIDITIHKVPGLPEITDKEKFICSDDKKMALADIVGASVNSEDNNTYLKWEVKTDEKLLPKDSISLLNQKLKNSFYVYQIDSVSKCVGKKELVDIYIDNPIKYIEVAEQPIRKCYGESVDIVETVKNTYATSPTASTMTMTVQRIEGYNLKDLDGNLVKSLSVDRYTDNSQQFHLEISEPKYNCLVKDTIDVIFGRLPKVAAVPDINVCAESKVTLNTLESENGTDVYTYETFVGSSTTPYTSNVIDEGLTETTTITVFATNEYTCKDTVNYDVKIRQNPEEAVVYPETFCQNTGTYPIRFDRKENDDNKETSINIYIYDADNNEVSPKTINTDNILVPVDKTIVKYTVRQENVDGGLTCYTDTEVEYEVRKAFDLKLEDLGPECQPTTVNLQEAVVNSMLEEKAVRGELTYTFGRVTVTGDVDITAADAEQLEYISDQDKVTYFYTVTDKDGICTARDEVDVTIHYQPVTPKVDAVDDLVFVCSDAAEMIVTAEDQNTHKENKAIVWTNLTTGGKTTGSKLSVSPKDKLTEISVISKDTITGCESEPLLKKVYGSDPVKALPITDSVKCAGEPINIKEVVESSFATDPYEGHGLTYKVYLGEDEVSLESLKAVTSDKQDTLKYRFVATDVLSKCTNDTFFTTIFHSLPEVTIKGKDFICQGDNIAFEAVGEERDIAYTWSVRDNAETVEKKGVTYTEKISENSTIDLRADLKIAVRGDNTDYLCTSKFEKDVTVRAYPEEAIIDPATFCQNTGVQTLTIKKNENTDNDKDGIQLTVYDADGAEVYPYTVDTDIDVTGEFSTITYTVRQTNSRDNLTCYTDKEVSFDVRRAFDLKMEDIDPVCHPETVDFVTAVKEYMSTEETKKGKLTYSFGKVGKVEGDVALNEEYASNLKYVPNQDKVEYYYTVTDNDGICTARDEVVVTIHHQPVTPKVDAVDDLVFVCSDAAEMIVTAEDQNTHKENKAIVWTNLTTGGKTTGNKLSVSPKDKLTEISVISKDTITGCESEPLLKKVYGSDPVKALPITDSVKCAGEPINIKEVVESSFATDPYEGHGLTYKVYLGEDEVSLESLKAVTSDKQDTLKYRFVATDVLSKCTNDTFFTTIFHSLPEVTIEGKDFICQGDNIAFEAVGEERDIAYTWSVRDNAETVEKKGVAYTEKISENSTIDLRADLKIAVRGDNTDYLCTSKFEKDVTVRAYPEKATVALDTFCQNTGKHELAVSKNPNVDNDIDAIELTVFDSDGTVIEPKIDSNIDVDGEFTTITYTFRQTNNRDNLTCYTDNKVSFDIRRAFDLKMEDIDPICQPKTVDFVSAVKEYMRPDEAKKGVLSYTFGKVEGSDKQIGENEAAELKYVDAQDQVTYYYTVTDKDGICSARDEVVVTIHHRPATPEILGGTDTVFVCKSAPEMIVKAKDHNIYEDNKVTVWSTNLPGDKETIAAQMTVSPSNKYTTLIAISRDTITGCESLGDTIVVYGSEPVKADILDPVASCTNDNVDIEEIMLGAFTTDTYKGHGLKYKAYLGENEVSVSTLKAVTSDKQDTLNFKFIATDSLSSCTNSTTLTAIFHSYPDVEIVGKDVVCEGDNALLEAVGEEREISYSWTVKDSDKLPVSSKKYTDNIEETQTVILSVGYNVGLNKDGSAYVCKKDIEYPITAHKVPAKPEIEKSYKYCQLTGEKTTELTPSETGYNFEWADIKDTIKKVSYVQSTDIDTIVKYSVRQINEQPGVTCYSDFVETEFIVNKHLVVKLKDTAICTEDFPLLSHVENNYIPSEPNFNPQPVRIMFKNGNTMEDITSEAASVNKSGLYNILYTDINECETDANINLLFVKRPQKPELSVSGTFNLCKGTDSLVTVTPISGNYDVLWSSTEPIDTVTGESLKIDATEITSNTYKVWRKNVTYGCVSDVVEFSYNVLDTIRIVPLPDIDICDYDTKDMKEIIISAFKSDNPLEYEVIPPYVAGMTEFDTTAANIKGEYILNAHDPISTCHASTKVVMNTYSKPNITVKNNKPVCQGDELVLSAEGANLYKWNGRTSESFIVKSESVGDFEVNLVASSVQNSSTPLTCINDTTFYVSFAEVPMNIVGKLDTAYCQDEVRPDLLSLTPTDPLATLVWFTPDDNYTSENSDKTLVPNTKVPGDYYFKFVQKLGICVGDTQTYKVEIQKAMTDMPVVKDAYYCKNETAPFLHAESTGYSYPPIWYHEDGTQITEEEFETLPSTAEAGTTKYTVKFMSGACLSQSATMKVVVSEPYKDLVDIDDSIKFCQGTVRQSLQPNTKLNTRLSWYLVEDGGDRMDSVFIDTYNNTWKESVFYVAQSVLDNCESERKKVVVTIADSIKTKDLVVETCLGSTLTIDEVFKNENLDSIYHIDNLYYSDSQQNLSLDANIAIDGSYLVSVHNKDKCEAKQKVKVNVNKVEGYTKIKDAVYCYGDDVTISPVSDNAVFELVNKNTDDITYFSNSGDKYVYTIKEPTDFVLTAKVKGFEQCTLVDSFSLDIHPIVDPKVVGDSGICIGNEVAFRVYDIVKDIVWTNKNDSVLATGSYLNYYPKEDDKVIVKGIDTYGCQAEKSVTVTVVPIPSPSIDIVPEIASTKYHLNRDTNSVKLVAVLPTVDDGQYTYEWDLSDGTTATGKEIEAEYSYARVALTSPIDVSVKVTHEFGCEATAVATILIDPSLKIPNTMTIEDEFMPGYYIEIFDRVGNLIYNGSDGWKGYKNDGKEAFEDTYFYAVTYFVEGEKKVQNGFITLIR